MSSLRLVAARGRPSALLAHAWRRPAKAARTLSSLAADTNTNSSSMDLETYQNTILSHQEHLPKKRQKQQADAALLDSASPLVLPFVHSRKTHAPVCVDEDELAERTEHVLSTETGNLFQFPRTGRTMDRQDRALAWDQADGTVQMVEYLVRGYSAQIPGTLWQEWTPHAKKCDDALTNLETMQQLIDRIWEEGEFYMQVRKGHLSQLAEWEEEEAKKQDHVRSIKFVGFNTGEDAAGESTLDRSAEQDKEEEEEEEEEAKEDNPLKDFALPGPTVAMYDVLLDTIAVTAKQAGDPRSFASRPASDLLTAKKALELLEVVEARHAMDGDDATNDNVHTMPTQISYNAVMRTAVNLYYDGENEVVRDWALIAAFQAHDLLDYCALEHNSSSYTYLIQTLHKYMPPCVSRANAIHGLWKLAKRAGVYDNNVKEAYLKATDEEPISEPHRDFIEKHLRKGMGPHRWRRRKYKFRMIPSQTTY